MTVVGERIAGTLRNRDNFSLQMMDAQGNLHFFSSAELREECSDYVSSVQGYQKGRGFEGTGASDVPGETGQKFLRAIELASGKVRWEYPMIGTAQSWAGTLSTTGGLVFFGDDNGYYVAVDAKNGKALWHFNTGAARLSASPMTFSVGEKQFVTLAAGTNIVTFGLME